MGEFEQELQRLLHSEFGGAGAPQLSELLRGLFPREAGSGPSLPSLDDALAAGLPGLDPGSGDSDRDVTASIATPSPGTVAPAAPADEAPILGTPGRSQSLRRLTVAALLGLLGGWLAFHGGGPPRGSLAVMSDPAGAEIGLAGRTVGYTPWLGMSLPAGTTVEQTLSADGHQPWRRSVKVPDRGRGEVRAELVARLKTGAKTPAEAEPSGALPLSDGPFRPWATASDDSATELPKRKGKRKKAKKAKPSDPVQMGTLDIRIKPTGVLVHGGVRRQSPVRNLNLPAGSHVLTVEHPDWGLTQRVKVEILPGEKTIAVANFKKPEKP
jgi:hypothetical protein